MKYVGEKEIINIFRYLEYLRCDHCNKKININEKYYEVVETNNDGDYDEKDICLNCINEFLKDKKFYDNDELIIKKTTLYKKPINLGRDEYFYYLASDDKGE